VDGDAELIRRVGAELYRDHWIAPFSAALAIDPRTVRRWAAGRDNRPQRSYECCRVSSASGSSDSNSSPPNSKATQHDQNLADQNSASI
jgi:tRNA A37 N6-isopentenylltransferase MiaA